MKVVLEIKGDRTPKQNDILVYDSVSEAFIFCSKYDFLKEVHKEIRDLRETCKETQNICAETKQDVQTIAKITKEGIK